MPLYEYRCESCGKQFDALRSMSAADAPIACNHCGGQQTRRQLSTFFSHSSGGSSATTRSSSGCGGCSGGSCGSCRH